MTKYGSSPVVQACVPVPVCIFTATYPTNGTISVPSTAVMNAIKSVCWGGQQYIAYWGGTLCDGTYGGLSGSATPGVAYSPTDDADNSALTSGGFTWASVDDKVTGMANAGWIDSTGATQPGLGIVPLAMGPAYMEGLNASTYYSNNAGASTMISPQYVSAWASYCQAVVRRYLNKGIRFFPVWNEWKGYYNSSLASGPSAGWDVSAFVTMYTAVWKAIKNDNTPVANGLVPAKHALIGGPYMSLTQNQPGQNGYNPNPGNDDQGNPIPQCWGGSNPNGNWGAVSPSVLYSYLAWLHGIQASGAGFDFCAVDMSAGDINGNNTGNYNPNGYNITPAQGAGPYVLDYYYDVTNWVWNNISAKDPVSGARKPILAVEAYGLNAPNTGYGLTQFGKGGGDALGFWCQPTWSGTSLQSDNGFYVMSDLTGTLIDTGLQLQTWLASNTPNSLLTPTALAGGSTSSGSGSSGGGGGVQVTTNIPLTPACGWGVTGWSTATQPPAIFVDDFVGTSLSALWGPGRMGGEWSGAPSGYTAGANAGEKQVYTPASVVMGDSVGGAWASRVVLEARYTSTAQPLPGVNGYPTSTNYTSGCISTGIGAFADGEAATGFQWYAGQLEMLIEVKMNLPGSAANGNNNMWAGLWWTGVDNWTWEQDGVEQVANSARAIQTTTHYNSSGSGGCNAQYTQGAWSTQPSWGVDYVYDFHLKTDGSLTVYLNGTLVATNIAEPNQNTLMGLIFQYGMANTPSGGWLGDNALMDYCVAWVAPGTSTNLWQGGGVAPTTYLPPGFVAIGNSTGLGTAGAGTSGTTGSGGGTGGQGSGGGGSSGAGGSGGSSGGSGSGSGGTSTGTGGLTQGANLMSLTDYSAPLIANALWGGGTVTFPTTWYVGLSTTVPTYLNQSSTWGVTEPTIGTAGYARASVANNGTNFGAASTQPTTAYQVTNKVALTFGTAPSGAWASGSQLIYAVWYDASSGGHAWAYEAIINPFAVASSMSSAVTIPVNDFTSNVS